MIVTRFDPRRDLIYVVAKVWSTDGRYDAVDMVVDTGAAMTLVSPEVTDMLGYGAHLAERRTVITSALGAEPGYLLKVTRFAALGFTVTDFPVHVHDLPAQYGIQGLIGMNFLRHFDYTVCSALGELRAERTVAAR